MKYDFIEIGTSDFETELQKSDDETFGISIEPIKYYLDRLPNKKNILKVNAAVSNRTGTVEVFYIPEETIKKFGLPDYVKGQNSIGSPHPETLKWDHLGVTINDITSETVEVLNFETIVKNYNVDSIGFLKIDTEGHDCVIINDYIDFCLANTNLIADKIMFESNILTNSNIIYNTIKRCIELGYKLITTGENTVLSK
jgi:FkbM family methyltransferase